VGLAASRAGAIFHGMASVYAVRGGVGGVIPGLVGPAELDGRAEWRPLREPRDLVEALAGRLGSEADHEKVLLAVLAPLRPALEGEPLGALLARLPPHLARELADAELNLNARVPAPVDVGEYLVEVAGLVLHPPRRAAEYVRAVFAAAQAVLAPEDAQAIAERLPPHIADLWRAAR
jgi:uncharacterized protein (DUF2267 family)